VATAWQHSGREGACSADGKQLRGSVELRTCARAQGSGEKSCPRWPSIAENRGDAAVTHRRTRGSGTRKKARAWGPFIDAPRVRAMRVCAREREREVMSRCAVELDVWAVVTP
jgi:hypothetical protein